MVAWHFVHYEQVGNYYDFGFQATSIEEIVAQVDDVFRMNQYELEAGQPSEGQYGVGNDIAHIFFGIFVRRFKFKVNVWQEANTIFFRLTKGMSGAAAGLLGVSRMNRETSRISGYFHSHFSGAGSAAVTPGGSGKP